MTVYNNTALVTCLKENLEVNLDANYYYCVLDYNIKLNRYNIGGVFISWSVSVKVLITVLNFKTELLNYTINLLEDWLELNQ